MRSIRWTLGCIILFLDWLFTPKGLVRTPEAQTEVDKLTSGLSLYQFKACPFCIKVRRSLKRSSINITLRDATNNPYRQELLERGGKIQAPCLKIDNNDGETQWLYESSDIISYIQKKLTSNGLSI